MSEEDPPTPQAHKTVEIEKIPDWAVALTEKVVSGNAQLKVIGENVELLQHDAKDTKLRLRRLETEVDEIKERQTRTSSGARQLSATDSKHEAAIAAIISEVASVKTMLADNNHATDRILMHASGWAQKHPAVVTAFVNLILAAMAYATWRLQR